MKKNKRILSLISAFAAMCTLSGCKDMKWEIEASKIANEQASIILDCFKTGNSEKLEALFCENISSTHDLKAEIAEAIEFIDGNIIDDGRWSGMTTGATSIDNGVITKLNIHPSIWDMKTDTGKEYIVTFTSYLIYESDPKYVGMTRIQVGGENGNIMIGEATY